MYHIEMQDYIEEPMGEPERIQHLCYAELCWELSRNVRYNSAELLRSLWPPLRLTPQIHADGPP